MIDRKVATENKNGTVHWMMNKWGWGLDVVLASVCEDDYSCHQESLCVKRVKGFA